MSPFDDPPHAIDRAIRALLVFFGVGVFAFWSYGRLQAGAAAQAAAGDWPRDRAAVAIRLHQPAGPDFGQVWRTRAGLTCGMVDGAFSFGGVLGMIPFYVEHGRPVFGGDVDDLAFAHQWRACLADVTTVLHEGTLVRGRCGTRRVRPHCRSVL